MNERESKIQKENNIRYAQKEPTNEGFVSRMDFIHKTIEKIVNGIKVDYFFLSQSIKVK